MANKSPFQTKWHYSVCQKPQKLDSEGTHCQGEEVMATKLPLRILYSVF